VTLVFVPRNYLTEFGSPRPGAVKDFNGRDALLRVCDGKPNTDAEHRVPTESSLQAQTNFFTAPLAGVRGADSNDCDCIRARTGVTVISIGSPE